MKTLAGILVLLMFTVVSVQGEAELLHHDLQQGLLHHWHLDCGRDWHDSPFMTTSRTAVALDSVGDAHASIKNMSPDCWVAGRQYTALQFDGTGAHLQTAADLGRSLGRDGTLVFWLRTQQQGSDKAAEAPAIAGSLGRRSLQWGWLDARGCLVLGVAEQAVARTSQPVNDGQWHHVALTRNATTGLCQIFLDGVADGQGQGARGTHAAAFNSLARLEARGVRPYFAGRLDQIYIFDRVLAAAEVAALRLNHAPKCWELHARGSGGRSFNTGSVFTRAFDVERDPLSVTRWTQPRHGAVKYNGDGSFLYRARSQFVGRDQFAVTLNDGRGGFQQLQVVVTVEPEMPHGGMAVTTFGAMQPLSADGQPLQYSGMRVPRLVHWSSPTRLDLLLGHGGSLWLYKNTGTVQKPAFTAAGQVCDVKGGALTSGRRETPFAVADISGNGALDVIIMDQEGQLRVYPNQATRGATPRLAADSFILQQADGSAFVAPDVRFDIGDWNGDGLPDIVVGARSGTVQLWLNVGSRGKPLFAAPQQLNQGSYNLFPRLFDLNQNGKMDYFCTSNWGSITYWRDAGSQWPVASDNLTLSSSVLPSVNLHQLTDGAIVDFGDINGDGTPDIVIGGHSSAQLYLALGQRETVAQSITRVEAVYDAHPKALGQALSADDNRLLAEINAANRILINHVSMGSLKAREETYARLSRHVRKYPFLRYQTLATNDMRHVPSIALQNWVILQNALPDTAARREEIADTMGLSDIARTIYLESGLTLGDNAKSIPAAYDAVRDLMRRHPRELFPDAFLTIDQLYGQGRGGLTWTPTSGKNTFGDWAVGPANEWSRDLTTAIEKILGPGAAHGDYFTFVMGHEVTHSLDHYVRSRANKDLNRRWGLMVAQAGGPDIKTGTNGWFSMTLTKAHFQEQGWWDGANDTWKDAWQYYWQEGAGKDFRGRSFMRGSIDWFLVTPQETLATQANHHWANGVGRLIGAAARFKEGVATRNEPLKANINEVVTFIDFVSVGMNRVNLVETKSHKDPQRVEWIDHYADLERDDRGYITGIKVDELEFSFMYRDDGVVTNVISALLECL